MNSWKKHSLDYSHYKLQLVCFSLAEGRSGDQAAGCPPVLSTGTIQKEKKKENICGNRCWKTVFSTPAHFGSSSTEHSMALASLSAV